MKTAGVRFAWACIFIPLMGLLTACSLFGVQPATPPGPGVPRIANLRFEPEVITVGAITHMSFYFEVGSADLHQGSIIERGISQFQFYQALQTISVDLGDYDGQVAGTVEVPLHWSVEGVRLLEVYVVTKKGNASNHLTGTITVR